MNKVVWEYLFQAYGGGPVLMIYIPIGLEEKKYANGSWIKVVELSRFLNLVRVCLSFPLNCFTCSYLRHFPGSSIAKARAYEMDRTMEQGVRNCIHALVDMHVRNRRRLLQCTTCLKVIIIT